MFEVRKALFGSNSVCVSAMMGRMIIHFICRGNAHRSLMAEAYLESLDLKDVRVMSSGSAADRYRDENEPRIPRVKAILENHDIAQFAKNRPDQLTQKRLDTADVTICLNQIVANECSKTFTMPRNTQVWDVDDTNEGHNILKPGDDPYKYSEDIFSLIKLRIDKLVLSLRLTTSQPAQA